MFRSVQEKTIGKGVVRTFAPDMGDWELIAEGGLDILGSINYESLIDSVFGTAWIRDLLKFLQMIGYVGSTFGFIQLIWVIYQKYIARGNRNRRRARRRRRRAVRGRPGWEAELEAEMFHDDYGPPPHHRDSPV